MGERGRGRGGHRGKKRDMGRNAWGKEKGDRRKQNDDTQAKKRQKIDNGNGNALPVYATKFDEEELKAEERRPKKKVAVLIGYSGTGYKGMQLAHDQKTIEGDLFQAFVAAGAISKANADDPKKSSFVRCARTDKGVHAAGNIISLKLIVEDEDIVKKINEHLNPQIRVWGYERTNNGFSAYQMVDSRIYEYLIPTHSFLPPHPQSYLAGKCVEWAEKMGDTSAYKDRQEEVEGYWEKIDEEQIRPILQEYDEDVRGMLEKALWLKAEDDVTHEEIGDQAVAETKKNGVESDKTQDSNEGTAAGAMSDEVPTQDSKDIESKRERSRTISEAIKRLRQAYITAKRVYRITDRRLDRVRKGLELYVGTRNYHNYTVQKEFKDASAKRVIKSFVVDSTPILIDGTEWLSLKVHGQSFMMHQIRKMVGMVALVVRCGCDPQRIVESYGPANISIPKAPSLGLLLERPIFDSYNKRAENELNRSALDFDRYKPEMDEFKQREIYERMYRDEEKDNVFGNFFNHVDNFPSETFLFLTSGGIEATKVEDADARDPASKDKVRPGEKVVDDGEDSDVDEVKDDAGMEG